jgi:hypothetical protein
MPIVPSAQNEEPQPKTQLPYTAKLPCLLRGSFYRFCKCHPSFYAVGKIAKNGWREQFASRNDMPGDWTGYLDAKPSGTHFGLIYTGPFFISCDHGCAHIADSHASTSCSDWEFRPARVFRQSESQIQRSGFVLVWAGIGEDSLDTAYGSLVEIGIAHASGIPILLAHHPQADLRPFWFAVETASAVVCTEKPVHALEMLHNARRCGR